MKTFITLALSVIFCIQVMAQTNHTVQMVDNAFTPQDIIVNVGDTVTWVNNGAMIHTSTSGASCTPDQIWDSGNIPSGGTFSFVFTQAGTFPYFCVPHCLERMDGTVTVQDPNSVKITNASLSQLNIFPNPATRSSNVSFSLNRPSYISIKLYCILGKEIITFEDGGFYNAGDHSISIKLEDVAAGKYILNFINDGLPVNSTFMVVD